MEVRIRLRFDSTPLHYAKKCCFLFDRDVCRTVSDLVFLISTRFGLQASGIQLFLEDYLLPPNESVTIVRDNDLLEVKSVKEDDQTTTNKRTSDDSLDIPATKRAKKRQKKKESSSSSSDAADITTGEREKSGTAAETNTPRSQLTHKPKILKSVERKSATGGVHLTFHSSSSSSSSSDSSSSSSSSDEEEEEEEEEEEKQRKRKEVVHKTIKKQNHSRTFTPSTSSQPPPKNGHDALGSRVSKDYNNHSVRAPFVTPASDGDVIGISPGRGGGGRGERGRLGRGRGGRGGRSERGRGRGGRVVGGRGDILTVRSQIFINRGTVRGRSRGRGRGRGWDVKNHDPITPNNSEQNSKFLQNSKSMNITNKTSSSPPDESIWETSKAGYTEEQSKEMPLPIEETEEEINTADPQSQAKYGNDGTKVTPPPPPRDYSSLPSLLGAPRIGDVIAFKVVELSSNCTPEVSDYQEAKVMEYDEATSTVIVNYLTQPHSKGDPPPEGSKSSELLRCVMTEEEGEEEGGGGGGDTESGSHDNHVTLNLGSLLQPKLIS